MAAEISVAFGAELKDGFKQANAWVTGGIQWLDEIQQFYRERSAIEREYSQKLATLAKKYFEKKARKSSSLSVGDNPTVTPGSLESASMTTWARALSRVPTSASGPAVPWKLTRPASVSMFWYRSTTALIGHAMPIGVAAVARAVVGGVGLGGAGAVVDGDDDGRV